MRRLADIGEIHWASRFDFVALEGEQLTHLHRVLAHRDFLGVGGHILGLAILALGGAVDAIDRLAHRVPEDDHLLSDLLHGRTRRAIP